MWRVSVRYTSADSSVFAHACLAGMLKKALSVAAIVEGKNVKVCRVHPRDVVHCIAQIASCAVQVERDAAALGGGRDPPTLQLWDSVRSVGELNGVKREGGVGGCARDHRGRMIEQLPTALPEEQAQREPCADRRKDR